MDKLYIKAYIVIGFGATNETQVPTVYGTNNWTIKAGAVAAPFWILDKRLYFIYIMLYGICLDDDDDEDFSWCFHIMHF